MNRGFAVLGDRLFMTTLDAHLVALDMKTGDVALRRRARRTTSSGYSATVAPLVVKDKVIVGDRRRRVRHPRFHRRVRRADRQARLALLHGRRARAIPARNTWPQGDAYLRGGGSIWVTGTYDPEQNLVFFGTGNPGPDYYSNAREGDNLYTASLVALDADTGELRWHYQFTPHDVHDWDSTQVPVLGELTINGQPRKVVMFANRNGFFYTIDRVTGKVIVAKPFVETTWAKEIDADRPADAAAGPSRRTKTATRRVPISAAAPTSCRRPTIRRRGLFFVTARETCATYFAYDQKFKPGEQYTGGGTVAAARSEELRRAARDRSGDRRDRNGSSAITSVSASGVLTTASGLVFAGDGDGNIMAFDSRTGKNLWHYQLGFAMRSTAGTTYMLDGRQYLLVPAGSMLTAFALPPQR